MGRRSKVVNLLVDTFGNYLGMDRGCIFLRDKEKNEQKYPLFESAPHWNSAHLPPDDHSLRKSIEDRSRIGMKTTQKHIENRNTQPHPPNPTKKAIVFSEH
jgi:hypothetical protein